MTLIFFYPKPLASGARGKWFVKQKCSHLNFLHKFAYFFCLVKSAYTLFLHIWKWFLNFFYTFAFYHEVQYIYDRCTCRLFLILTILFTDSTDIVDCKLKLILGLIWTLILHYSISMPMWEGEEEPSGVRFFCIFVYFHFLCIGIHVYDYCFTCDTYMIVYVVGLLMLQ